MISLLDLAITFVVMILSKSVYAQRPSPEPNATITGLPSPPPTGTGAQYAKACASAYSAFHSGQSSWNSRYRWISNQTQIQGGTVESLVTYYQDATTLCDWHARITYSPAISLSTGIRTRSAPAIATSTVPVTYDWYYPASLPSCLISQSDCEPLWRAYSSSLSAFQAKDTSTNHQSLKAVRNLTSPATPPCQNQAQASSNSAVIASINGCNVCTIYGQDVQLVYFPTTASRDMCASTPTGSLTQYDGDAVLEVYAGSSYSGSNPAAGKETVVVNGNTFTSGTAYISIGSVWAADRCSKTVGQPVTNAILALPSESLLSLRYSQIHFQRLMTTDKQTGYPVNYADFNSPVPWSAWNGQSHCVGPSGGFSCDVIYENEYRPQLAMPPGIRKLNRAWEDCQMWYGGLYDPPVALTKADQIIRPSNSEYHPASQAATPAWTPSSSTPKVTDVSHQTGAALASKPGLSRQESWYPHTWDALATSDTTWVRADSLSVGRPVQSESLCPIEDCVSRNQQSGASSTIEHLQASSAGEVALSSSRPAAPQIVQTVMEWPTTRLTSSVNSAHLTAAASAASSLTPATIAVVPSDESTSVRYAASQAVGHFSANGAGRLGALHALSSLLLPLTIGISIWF